MVKFNSIESFCESVQKGTFGIYGATLTEKRMNKYPCGCGRVAGTENPYAGRVFNLAISQNVATGVGYYKLVESECKREGINFSKEEFEKAFPKESTYCESVSDKLANMIMEYGNQRYLRMYFGRKPTRTIYKTIVDGNIVTDKKVLDDIARYTPASSGSRKQEELGISNIVKVKQPKVENVLFLMQGDKVWFNPKYEYMFDINTLADTLYEMFKK